MSAVAKIKKKIPHIRGTEAIPWLEKVHWHENRRAGAGEILETISAIESRRGILTEISYFTAAAKKEKVIRVNLGPDLVERSKFQAMEMQT